MVRINLLNGYFIEWEPLNYTLKREYQGKKKDGTAKTAVKTIGYFGDLEGAIRRFLKLNQIDEMDGLNVEMIGYVKYIEQVNEEACMEIISALEED